MKDVCPKCGEGVLDGPLFYRESSGGGWFDRLEYICSVCRYRHLKFTKDDIRRNEDGRRNL